jgi:N-methylhydantoinase B/oxoprolinase/acetone carboxylase alpha subunit
MDMVASQWWAKFFRGIGRPCEVSRTKLKSRSSQHRDGSRRGSSVKMSSRADHWPMAAQCRDEPPRGGTPKGVVAARARRTWKFHINGKSVRDAKKLTMQPADVVLFETPGGGAYGHRRIN